MYVLFFALISSYGISKIIEIGRAYMKLQSDVGWSLHVPQQSSFFSFFHQVACAHI